MDTGNYETVCKRLQEDKNQFWSDVAETLVWTKKWNAISQDELSPSVKWFVGGELNMCFNCVDRHVEEGHGERTAFIFNSPVTDTLKEYTFNEVLYQVSRLAGVLTRWDVKKGDVVLIYMPMIPEGVFGMLACARLGALHVCVPSGLPPHDLAIRLDHAQPKVVLAASFGYHPSGWLNYKTQLDTACQTANNKPEKILVYHRTFKDSVPLMKGRDFDWMEEMKSATPVSCTSTEANEPLFMVYTSGSTGTPKGIVHAVGRYAVRLKVDMPLFFGRWDGDEDEVLLMTSNFGWIAGHTLVVYGPLLQKIKPIVFEGDPLLTEDVRALYELMSKCKVTRAVVRPGIFKLLKSKDPDGKVAAEYNFENLKVLFTGGERIDMNTMHWTTKVFDAPLWNGYGQSEVGGYLSGVPDLSFSKSSRKVMELCRIAPSWDVVIMKSDGAIAKVNEVGRILLRLPLPPGVLSTIFNNDAQFQENYFSEFPGYFDTKDEGYLNEEGLLGVECRADDIMKVGQIYLAAQAVEEAVATHPAVAQCVVVSIPDLVWKEIPAVIYIMREGNKKHPEEVAKEMEKLVYSKFGSSVKFGGAVVVNELPCTRTGKVHRPSCNSLARGKPVMNTGAVENPHVFEHILQSLKNAGFGKDVLLE